MTVRYTAPMIEHVLNVTISCKHDFVNFNVKVPVNYNCISAGDKLKFKDRLFVISHKVYPVLEPDDVGEYYECAPYKVDDYLEFYKILDFFKMRFAFIGRFIASSNEPLPGYKIYRLYKHLMDEEDVVTDDTLVPVVQFGVVEKLVDVVGLNISDVDLSQYCYGDKLDLLELLLDITDGHDFGEFDSDAICAAFRSL